MANISQINVSGTVYNIKDAEAREQLNAFEVSGISVVTQAQYEALDPLDPSYSDTLYLITEEASP